MTDLRQAAQQALEALCSAVEPKKGKVYAREFEPIDCFAMHEQAITALREALEQPEQEPWEPSDTAYRPGGLPQDFTKHEVNSADAWSEWVCPDPTQYFMKCCDCGLIHEMQFNIVKYSEGDNCEDFDDPYVQAVFRARRTTPPAAQPEQWDKPSASFNEWWDSDSESKVNSTNPFRNGSAAYWAWAGWQAAQRPWQGLTEGERNDLEDYCEMIIGKAAFDAIEAKLKEKNT
jgi:hypothetical protein